MKLILPQLFDLTVDSSYFSLQLILTPFVAQKFWGLLVLPLTLAALNVQFALHSGFRPRSLLTNAIQKVIVANWLT